MNCCAGTEEQWFILYDETGPDARRRADGFLCPVVFRQHQPANCRPVSDSHSPTLEHPAPQEVELEVQRKPSNFTCRIFSSTLQWNSSSSVQAGRCIGMDRKQTPKRMDLEYGGNVAGSLSGIVIPGARDHCARSPGGNRPMQNL